MLGQGVKTGVLKGQGAHKFGQGAAPFYFVLEETLRNTTKFGLYVACNKHFITNMLPYAKTIDRAD